MSLSDSNMVLPVAPAYGNNGGFGAWGSDIWLILIVLFAMGGFGGFGGYGGGMGYDFPWLYGGQQNILAGVNANTNAGFNQAATQSAINGLQNSVTAGFGDVALGFAGVNQSICQTGNGVTNAITQSQIAAMQNANAIQSQLAQCCCDNRLATANLSALVQSENCADRAAVSDGLRDVLVNQNANTQKILDQLCADKIDAKNEKIAELQAQVNMQNLAASQAAQTAQLIADNTAQTQYIVNRVAPYPQPAIVYGYNTNWMNGNGCGCGCGMA